MKQIISNFAGEVQFEWNGFDMNDNIRAIKHFPSIFIGNEHTINSLRQYLYGYMSALRICDKEEFSFPNYYHFGDWIQGKLKFKYKNNGGWCHNILEKCKGDSEKAFDKFFKYYDEFSKSKPICYQIKITDSHRKFAEKDSVIKRFKSTQDYEQEKKIVVPEKILVFQLLPTNTHWFVYINSDGFIDYENMEISFDKLKIRINKEFKTNEIEWKQLEEVESYELYHKVFISKEISKEERFLTVTTESF